MPLSRFEKAIEKVKELEKHDRYIGAFVFGSVARGESTDDSDLDVKVVISGDDNCSHISHPFIDGIKLDITFLSQSQVTQQTRQEVKNRRVPMIAESIILFDKTGFLKSSKEAAQKIKPPKTKKSDYPTQQFLIYHYNDRVERDLDKDPESSLLSMDTGISEILKIHYGIHGKWWISSKRILKDLDQWDSPLAKNLRIFVRALDIKEKYKAWASIVNRITEQMGGKMDIEDIICGCDTCKKDIENLLK